MAKKKLNSLLGHIMRSLFFSTIIFPLLQCRHRGIKAYGVALFLVAAAFGLRLIIAPENAGFPYITFFPAVTITALLCGFWPGIFACAVSIILATDLVMAPHYAWSEEAVQNWLYPALIFLADGLLVCLSIDAIYRYRMIYEEKLVESEKTYAILEDSAQHVMEILDNLFAHVALLDLDGRVLEMNKVPLEQGGQQRKDVIGQFFFDTAWWSYDDQVRAQLIEAIAAARSGEVRRYDVLVRVGQDLVPIDFQISPVRDASGRIVRLLPTAIDISVRKTAEAALENAKLLMDLIVQNIPTAVFLKRASDLRFELINKAAEEVFGCPASAVIGKNSYDFFRKEDADLFTSEDRKVIAEGGVKVFPDEVITRRNGELRYLDTRKVPLIDASGQASHLLGIALDITERKKAEESLLRAQEELRISKEFFQNLFESAPVGMAICDLAGRYTRVNAAMCNMMGYSAAELLSMNFIDITHPDDVMENIGQRSLALSGELSMFRMKKRYRHKNGQTIFVVMVESVVSDPDNGPIYTIGHMIGIDKEKEMEERLTLAHEQRDTLVREVHHRIKNNLQSVTGLLHRQIQEKPSVAGALTAAISQVETIAIMHGLQSVAHRGPLRLCDMLAEIVAVSNSLIADANSIVVHNELRRPLLIADGETVPLALILNELLTNAAKHCLHSVDGVIEVSIKQVDLDHACVTITNSAAELPGGFDFMEGVGVRLGLKLVRSLLPEKGIQVSFDHADGIVSVKIHLSPPVVYQGEKGNGSNSLGH